MELFPRCERKRLLLNTYYWIQTDTAYLPSLESVVSTEAIKADGHANVKRHHRRQRAKPLVCSSFYVNIKALAQRNKIKDLGVRGELEDVS